MHPFFKHTIGILKELWPKLLGLAIVIILFLWLLFSNLPQLKTDFGFVEPKTWARKSKAFILAGFEPIGLPARPKLEKRECSTEDGLCSPNEGIIFK